MSERLGSLGRRRHDAVIVGGGHNGLVAAALLGRSGRSVIVLERRHEVGGAAISGSPFEGVGARLSRYAYLVSLFPKELLRALGVEVELRRRTVSSYTPDGESGLLVDGVQPPSDEWRRFYQMLARVAARVYPTLTQPLRSREQLRRVVDDDVAWGALFERPLSGVLERTFSSDLVRGIVLTDGTIGTFAPAGDPMLRQNRCFLYHLIGNGTGSWDVPIGGMGALSEALAGCALRAGAEIRTDAEVVSIATDGSTAEVMCADGSRFAARHVLANVAPEVLSSLLGEGGAVAPGASAAGSRKAGAPEGSQLKINMLLRRLPRLRDRGVSPERAFAGTFHVNEGYEQLQRAYDEAAAGRIPSVPPCELYCHSLTDPSILSDELRAAGAQTLTLFGLHMRGGLFSDRATIDQVKEAAVAATLGSLTSVLAEPIEECLFAAPDGTPCIEALTPPELEAELGLPGGHIFHRDLAWPFAESEAEVGTWGVETEHPNVWLCGAGARRGGGVSGIPGHNAVRALLGAEAG
jgi:phytoene dehydrogenase-like protein